GRQAPALRRADTGKTEAGPGGVGESGGGDLRAAVVGIAFGAGTFAGYRHPRAPRTQAAECSLTRVPEGRLGRAPRSRAVAAKQPSYGPNSAHCLRLESWREDGRL